MTVKFVVTSLLILGSIGAIAQVVTPDNEYDLGSGNYSAPMFSPPTGDIQLNIGGNVIFTCKSQYFETCLVEAILDLQKRVEVLEADTESSNDR